jgi:thioredoxin-related protein
MIAVVAPGARSKDITRFVGQRFGSAPVTVYHDTTGKTFERLGPGYYPSHAFFAASGKQVSSLPGYPFD